MKAGAGAYVVAPPSLHPAGDRYDWGVAPWEVAPPPVPPTVAELLRERPSTPSVSHLELRIAAGQRNTALFAHGGRLRNAGLAESELRAALEAVNRERCDPPLGPAPPSARTGVSATVVYASYAAASLEMAPQKGQFLA